MINIIIIVELLKIDKLYSYIWKCIYLMSKGFQFIHIIKLKFSDFIFSKWLFSSKFRIFISLLIDANTGVGVLPNKNLQTHVNHTDVLGAQFTHLFRNQSHMHSDSCWFGSFTGSGVNLFSFILIGVSPHGCVRPEPARQAHLIIHDFYVTRLENEVGTRWEGSGWWQSLIMSRINQQTLCYQCGSQTRTSPSQKHSETNHTNQLG